MTATVRLVGNREQLSTLRGNAFNAYAGLELALLTAMIRFADMEPEVASIIFYRVNNTRQRNSIIDQLKKRAWKDRASLFWNSTIKELNKIDQERNELAHWHVRMERRQEEPDKFVGSFVLQPPNIYTSGPSRTEADLHQFIGRCEYLSALIHMFVNALYYTPDLFAQSPWRERFQQALVYPPQSPRQ
jgi:hypothetical protein